jgi:integrase/16S rRNA G966 N2-methylase RsmD
MGCKQRIASRLARLIEAEKPKRVFDLCCGTGAISMELLNRGFEPSKLAMVDAGPWGAFWEAVSTRSFPIERLAQLVELVPKRQTEINKWITQLAGEESRFCPAAFVILSAASFGSKPIRFDPEFGRWTGPGWKTVKSTWQPKNQFSAITPRPVEILARVQNIVARMQDVRAFHRDVHELLGWFGPGDVVYIDPPYAGQTGYGAELVDVEAFAQQIAQRGAVVLVSEARALSAESYSLGRVRRGKVSGGPGNGSEEWISYFRPPVQKTAIVPAPHSFSGYREIVVSAAVALPDPPVSESAKSYAVDARAPETRRAYAAQWSAFTSWCASQGLASLPAAPSTVASYLAARADGGTRPSSLDVALAAIAKAHVLAHHPNPREAAEVREVRAGIRRRLGTRPKQKRPIPVDALRSIMQATRPGLTGLRDRALMLVGFAGGFRRSELVALDWEDVAFVTDGVEVLIGRAKNDQEGAGRKLGIPHGTVPATCPVRALAAWLDASKITEGPIFRQVRDNAKLFDGGIGDRLSPQAVARVVKQAAESVDFDPKLFSGHSLRAGLVTAAAKSNKSNRAIRRQTGHHSDRMVDEYVRDAQLLDDDNAAKGIGL